MTTTGSTAAPSNDPKEHSGAARESVSDQTVAGASPSTRDFSLQALSAVILENLKLLLLGPVIVGLVAFGIASVMPKQYTSVAYLLLDEPGARAADGLMRSQPVLDKVFAGVKVSQDVPPEELRGHLATNRRIVLAPGEISSAAKLYRLEYSDRDPHLAQKVNSLFIDTWLQSTTPRPDHRSAIEAEIVRRDLKSKSISQLIDRLQKEAQSLVTQSLQGELATPIVNLIEMRDQNLGALITLRNSLNGLSRDVVFATPDLPVAPSWPNKGMIAILAGFIASPLLLMLVILRRFGQALI